MKYIGYLILFTLVCIILGIRYHFNESYKKSKVAVLRERVPNVIYHSKKKRYGVFDIGNGKTRDGYIGKVIS